MKASLLFITLISLLTFSCSVTPERKPAVPQGSDVGDMPWNTPGAGEGQGAFGGAMSR